MISFVSRLINRSACLHFFDYAQGQLGSGLGSPKHAQAAKRNCVK